MSGLLGKREDVRVGKRTREKTYVDLDALVKIWVRHGVGEVRGER